MAAFACWPAKRSMNSLVQFEAAFRRALDLGLVPGGGARSGVSAGGAKEGEAWLERPLVLMGDAGVALSQLSRILAKSGPSFVSLYRGQGPGPRRRALRPGAATFLLRLSCLLVIRVFVGKTDLKLNEGENHVSETLEWHVALRQRYVSQHTSRRPGNRDA